MEQLLACVEQLGPWGWVLAIVLGLGVLLGTAWGLLRFGLFVMVIGQQLNKKQKEDFEKRSN
ncbi:MAG: hypothetical protein D6730_03150 [Bacteroidetes bacterium]|nr:MAG: hypothetical protein D6730_03150 [Bacteroidota bacterium]